MGTLFSNSPFPIALRLVHPNRTMLAFVKASHTLLVPDDRINKPVNGTARSHLATFGEEELDPIRVWDRLTTGDVKLVALLALFQVTPRFALSLLAQPTRLPRLLVPLQQIRRSNGLVDTRDGYVL
jgi:hypothetical protein